jgi:hypothetical protein
VFGTALRALVDAPLELVTLIATNGHPFWVESKNRWTDAADLRPSDVLTTATGEPAQVLTTLVRQQRPSMAEAENALRQAGPRQLEGQNSSRFDHGDVRVIVNWNKLLKSTAYYPGR